MEELAPVVNDPPKFSLPLLLEVDVPVKGTLLELLAVVIGRLPIESLRILPGF
jgi:hypothetical protein